jgi:hypothetical protein
MREAKFARQAKPAKDVTLYDLLFTQTSRNSPLRNQLRNPLLKPYET